MGRLTLNILLSFAQFEREIISERTRDRMSAARRRGKWVGGLPVLGYDVAPGGGRLIVNAEEAARVRAIYHLYLDHKALTPGRPGDRPPGMAHETLDDQERHRSRRQALHEEQPAPAAHQRHLCREGELQRLPL